MMNKKKNLYTFSPQSKKDLKSISEGYESTKFINKIYTSKTKRKFKTRDKQKNIKVKNIVNLKDISINQSHYYNTSKSFNNSNYISYSITDSVNEKYCKLPSHTILNYMDEEKFNILEEDWIII